MKATLPDGTVLEGNHEELTGALRSLQGGNVTSSPAANGGGGTNVANGFNGTSVWTMERVHALWACIYGDQKKLIQYLLSKGTASVPEILGHLGLKKGAELAGVRSSLTRNARRETGYKKAKVIQWTLGANDHKWYYEINPEVKALLQLVVKEEK